MTVPPAGWYPDPHNSSQQRYWDGTQWTQHVAVTAPAAPPAPPASVNYPPAPLTPPAPAYYPAEPAKKKLGGGAIAAIVIGSVVLVLFVGGILAAIAIPVFLSQRGQAEDAAAKADVSTLGKEIATHFVDSSQLPEITANGDEYTIHRGDMPDVYVAQSEGVALNSYWMDSNVSWCVSVVAPDGLDQTFRYSAAAGLEVGVC